MSDHMMFSGVGLILALFVILLAVAALLFWVWMLVDAVQKEEGASKIAWVLIILFLHFLGALIYFFVRKLPR
jgi:hypothetical protein